MDTGLYAPYRRANAVLVETGLIKGWINLTTDFTLLNDPAPGEAPVAGDNYKITADHTWAVGKGPLPIYIYADTLEAPAASSGTKGSLRLIQTPKLFIIGDGAPILEMVNNWLNQQIVLFVQDQCNGPYIQYGCSCLPAAVSKVGFSTGTLKSGQKGYDMEIESYNKFFYSGAFVERP